MLTMSTLKKSPTEFHHGELRESLITAGIKQVESHGLNSLSLRQLSIVTGVSQTAAYRHFEDLEHLKAEVSKASREILGKMMLARIARIDESDPRKLAIARLWEAGDAYIEFGMRRPNLFEIAFISYDSPKLKPEDPSPWGILNSCLDQLYEKKLISAETRKDGPLIAWSMVHGFAGLASQRFTGTVRETKLSAEIVLNSVLRSLKIR